MAVDQTAVNLFAELGNLLANVSPSVVRTSSLHGDNVHTIKVFKQLAEFGGQSSDLQPTNVMTGATEKRLNYHTPYRRINLANRYLLQIRATEHPKRFRYLLIHSFDHLCSPRTARCDKPCALHSSCLSGTDHTNRDEWVHAHRTMTESEPYGKREFIRIVTSLYRPENVRIQVPDLLSIWRGTCQDSKYPNTLVSVHGLHVTHPSNRRDVRLLRSAGLRIIGYSFRMSAPRYQRKLSERCSGRSFNVTFKLNCTSGYTLPCARVVRRTILALPTAVKKRDNAVKLGDVWRTGLEQLLEDRIARLLMEQEKSRSEKDKLLAQIHEQNMKLYHMQQVLESSESHTLEDLPDSTYPVTVEQPYDQKKWFRKVFGCVEIVSYLCGINSEQITRQVPMVGDPKTVFAEQEMVLRRSDAIGSRIFIQHTGTLIRLCAGSRGYIDTNSMLPLIAPFGYPQTSFISKFTRSSPRLLHVYRLAASRLSKNEDIQMIMPDGVVAFTVVYSTYSTLNLSDDEMSQTNWFFNEDFVPWFHELRRVLVYNTKLTECNKTPKQSAREELAFLRLNFVETFLRRMFGKSSNGSTLQPSSCERFSERWLLAIYGTIASDAVRLSFTADTTCRVFEYTLVLAMLDIPQYREIWFIEPGGVFLMDEKFRTNLIAQSWIVTAVSEPVITDKPARHGVAKHHRIEKQNALSVKRVYSSTAVCISVTWTFVKTAPPPTSAYAYPKKHLCKPSFYRLLLAIPQTTTGPPSLRPTHRMCTDNDYPVRSMGEALTLPARNNRVTLKIDVPYTDHSHVIGRGGRNIKSVMLATQCHIHFPDLNKTNLVEKSNQDMLPVTFIFELPLSATLQPNVFRNSPFVRQLEEVYEVDICYRNIHTSPRTRTVVNVKGLSANSRMIKTAVRLLLERYYGSNEIVPITMIMELDATHQTGFFAQKSPEEVAKLVAQTTGAVVSFRKSNALDSSRGMLETNKTAAKLEFMDSLCQFSRNLSCGNAATIEITGLNVDSVFLARQLITNLLPVVLLFDVTLEESEWLRKFDFARLQQQYDVSIDIRNKPKQLNRSVVVRTNEKNVRAVYTIWQLTTDFLRRTAPSSWILAPVAEQSNDRYSDPGSDIGAGQRTIDASYWNLAGCCPSIRQVKVSVQADREVWRTQKAKEMEEAQKAGNARRLFQLIRATGPRKPPVNETVKDRKGKTILNKEERLDRWAEYFEQQLSWPPAAPHLERTVEVEPWTLNVEPPTASETSGRVRVYGELSQRFRTQSGVRQGCSLSPFLFNFVIDELMRRTLEGLQNPGVQIDCDESFVDLEYADIVLIFEGEKAQVFLDELTKLILSFGIHFAPTKSASEDQNTLLQSWIRSNSSNSVIQLISQATMDEIAEIKHHKINDSMISVPKTDASLLYPNRAVGQLYPTSSKHLASLPVEKSENLTDSETTGKWK
ncbi:protein bicaudal C homolog 1 [Clonorchis sinensis]|uniref:Protein bicaudal C homolog 1 n=1 Tax=Clonorchis sinensis TaxID=79923 RepID=G7YE23_CLOSI|nr:protein bicaudal C homolog 1 [Clonorchis sinensis]